MHLDMLKETRNVSEMMVEARNQVVARYYNSRVNNKQFRSGDLLLRNTESNKPPIKRGKKAPTWEGLYQVHKVIRFGAYKLVELDGKEIPRTWNVRHLNKFYV
ncbi:hypothetical protein HRI_000267500 [Hibiscus trionum]|uniref:Reverse transcriptase n=1 Tax=Hibiscus trionum TaxID=183268 RepID=A0A9W7GVU8_HIBTR|nr:hypothetical protein HRI_000267500 [Hibiscus trionum]